MKTEILKLSIIASLLLSLMGCEGSSGGDEHNSTIATGEVLPEGVSNPIGDTQNGEMDDCILPTDECVDSDDDNLSPAISRPNGLLPNLQFLPEVDMKVGVDYDYCNRVVPTNSVKYVYTSGDDNSADGSMSSPYKTVFKAVEDAQAGDMIVIRGGTYVETGEIRVRVPNVTITSYPDEWAVIDRSSSTYAGSNKSGIYLDVDSDGSTVQCLEIKGGLYALSTETKWDWDEVDKMGATNITVQSIKAHDSYADVVKVKPNSDDFNISYSELYDSGVGQDADDCNAEGIDNVNADRMTASHLYVHDICSNGIYLKGGAKDGVVEYSFVEDTGEGGIMLGFDTSPDYFDANNQEMYEAISAKAHHNLIKNAKGAGIGLYASKDSEVYNNTIVDTSSRFHAPIYFGISFQDGAENANRPANINPSVHHNIVSQHNDTPIVSIRYSDEFDGLSALDGDLHIDYNCYSFVLGGFTVPPIYFEDGRDRDANDNAWRGDFLEWRTHIEDDYNSENINPQLNTKSVTQIEECRYMGYKRGHSLTDDIILP